MLETELEFFESNQKTLREDYPGKFVLIKGDQLVAAFDSEEGALADGARRFGLDNYLIRNVNEETQELHVPALTLGLLHADPPCADWTHAQG